MWVLPGTEVDLAADTDVQGDLAIHRCAHGHDVCCRLLSGTLDLSRRDCSRDTGAHAPVSSTSDVNSFVHPSSMNRSPSGVCQCGVLTSSSLRLWTRNAGTETSIASVSPVASMEFHLCRGTRVAELRLVIRDSASRVRQKELSRLTHVSEIVDPVLFS